MNDRPIKHTTLNSGIHQITSPDGSLNIIVWSDGCISFFHHESQDPEPDSFIKLDQDTVSKLAVMLVPMSK